MSFRKIVLQRRFLLAIFEKKLILAKIYGMMILRGDVLNIKEIPYI